MIQTLRRQLADWMRPEKARVAETPNKDPRPERTCEPGDIPHGMRPTPYNRVILSVNGSVYIPIPGDSTDAYELYRESPLVRCVVDAHAQDSDEDVEDILLNGPDVIGVTQERIGIYP